MQKSIILFCLLTVFSACHKDKHPNINSKGQIVKLDYIWKYSLHENNEQHSNSIIDANLVFDNKALLATTKTDGTRWLTAVDINSGQKLWSWSDVYQPETEDVNIRFFHQYNNLLQYIKGKRNYCINLDNGTTHWKILRDDYFDVRVNGEGADFYLLGNAVDTLENYNAQIVFKGNMENGEILPYLYPNINFSANGENNLVTGIHWITPLTIENKLHFAVSSSDPSPNWYYNKMVGLYNAADETWVYDRILSRDSNQSNAGINQVYENKIVVNGGRGIICHDLNTGEKLWSHEFPQDFLFSGFAISDGKVIANCENSTLYCMDINTGDILWTGEGAGTSSPLRDRILNGIVYFSGGSTSRIHAVDINPKNSLKKDKIGHKSFIFKVLRTKIFTFKTPNFEQQRYHIL